MSPHFFGAPKMSRIIEIDPCSMGKQWQIKMNKLWNFENSIYRLLYKRSSIASSLMKHPEFPEKTWAVSVSNGKPEEKNWNQSTALLKCCMQYQYH